MTFDPKDDHIRTYLGFYFGVIDARFGPIEEKSPLTSAPSYYAAGYEVGFQDERNRKDAMTALDDALDTFKGTIDDGVRGAVERHITRALELLQRDPTRRMPGNQGHP